MVNDNQSSSSQTSKSTNNNNNGSISGQLHELRRAPEKPETTSELQAPAKPNPITASLHRPTNQLQHQHSSTNELHLHISSNNS
ncbi:hypothetical protein KY290_024142 [Solanum tuberosum]|uniref:Uncharacterized protein n=1 Tax=Solanum tuberosum TaxID=4113 RepID=A0ABQ7UPV7_SOLTU|nr:hypothetical protein KY285_022914 [Solanum tuberosum]KAH0675114.1 hypothetical protein KY285_022915 [Solanum tuberosum]KAH0753871.1 hypothetical protein KY290_024141 [Solanum tuberosum]KAH0753872.1 hypothetical protein KY290_024142 [Solanum tuberosum]